MVHSVLEGKYENLGAWDLHDALRFPNTKIIADGESKTWKEYFLKEIHC